MPALGGTERSGTQRLPTIPGRGRDAGFSPRRDEIVQSWSHEREGRGLPFARAPLEPMARRPLRALDLTLRSGRCSQLARRLCLAFSVALTLGFRLRTVSVKGAGLADDFPGARLIHCLPVVEVPLVGAPTSIVLFIIAGRLAGQGGASLGALQGREGVALARERGMKAP